MQNDMDKTQFFCEYYKQWIEIYKRGAIREATMAKYLMTQKWDFRGMGRRCVCL